MLNDTAYLREATTAQVPKYIEMPIAAALPQRWERGSELTGDAPPALTYVGTVDEYLPTAEPPPIVVAGEAVLRKSPQRSKLRPQGRCSQTRRWFVVGGLCTADRFANCTWTWFRGSVRGASVMRVERWKRSHQQFGTGRSGLQQSVRFALSVVK